MGLHALEHVDEFDDDRHDHTVPLEVRAHFPARRLAINSGVGRGLRWEGPGISHGSRWNRSRRASRTAGRQRTS
jgi:hypothetical protein